MAGVEHIRGRIWNRPRRLQCLDFSALRWGNITPTDLDLALDFNHGEYFVFGEFKLGATQLPSGQREHIESLCEAIAKPAVAFIAEHWDISPGDDIRAHECMVREVWWCNRWQAPQWGGTVGEFIDFMRDFWGIT